MSDDSILIDIAGGPSALAAQLQLTTKGAAQRVSNWRGRGIPAKVQLEHRAIFDDLRARAAAHRAPPVPAEQPQEVRDAA